MNRSAESPPAPRLRPRYKWELLALLFCTYFFHQGDRAIFGVLQSKIQNELGLTGSQLGMVGTVMFATLALMVPIAGYLGDVWNRKKIIIGSLLFWSTATMLTGTAGGLAALIAFRSVATAGGESFYAPAAYPLLAAHHTRTRALALAIHQSSLYIGVMLCGFIANFLADRWGWRSAFFIYGSGGILLGLVLMGRMLDAPPVATRSAQGGEDSLWGALGVLFRSPTALLLTAGFTAIVFVNNAFLQWAPAFLEKRFDLARGGGYAMFYHHLPALLGILLSGSLSDRIASTRPVFRLQLMSSAMLLGAPAIYFMGRASELSLACWAIAAFGFFRGLYEANTHAALFQVIAPRHRASAVGVMTMLGFLVGSLSTLFLGYLSDRFPGHGLGLSYGFSALSGAYLLGGLALLVAVHVTFKRDFISGESS